MTKPKHTPGPWTLETGVIGRERVYDSKGEMCIASFIGGETFEEGDANACLIAAAPDMLEALRCALVYLGSDATDDSPEAAGVRATLHHAIAKAEGAQ